MKEPFYQNDKLKLFISQWEERPGKYKLPQSLIFPKNTYSPWDQTDFKEIYSRVKNNTLVDKYRCFELYDLMNQIKKNEGDIIEVGVWRGGTGLILQEGLGDSDKLYLCDTFEGVVKAGNNDNIYKGGEHADTNAKNVENLFDNNQIIILKGIFPDQTSLGIENVQLKFVHIDVDVYLSAKDVFEWCYSRLIPGAIVVFDDYGFAACEGVTKYVNELKEDKNLIVTYNLNGHAIVIKK